MEGVLGGGSAGGDKCLCELNIAHTRSTVMIEKPTVLNSWW